MLMPPVIARPFGHVVEPVRMKSASSFQKNVGLKISMYGSAATSMGAVDCAVCAWSERTAPARAATPATMAISSVPDDFMVPL